MSAKLRVIPRKPGASMTARLIDTGARCDERRREDSKQVVFRYSEGAIAHTDSRNSAAERDRAAAWLDEASERFGVARDAVLAAAARQYGGATHATRELLLAAAASIANTDAAFRATLAARVDAMYGCHNDIATGDDDAAAAHDHNDDDAFRAAIARQSGGAL